MQEKTRLMFPFENWFATFMIAIRKFFEEIQQRGGRENSRRKEKF